MLFAGAPPASSLSPESCTLESIDNVFSAFLGLSPSPSPSIPPPLTSQSSPITWRSLSLKKQPLHTNFSQTHNVSNSTLPSQPGFFTTLDVSLDDQESSPKSDAAQDALSQFYDHALAVHNSFTSTQLDSFAETSFDDTSFMGGTSLADQSTSAGPPVPSHLSDLEDVPSARQIQALNPQTVTLNLIVGVISIAQPRTVTTRWGRTLSLVEILVGDDTKSGFAVTFWLSDDDDAAAGVHQLRRQDVVLLQNVALHVFRGKVYGQSLRRGMTKVGVLWRRDGSGHYSGRDLLKRGQVHPQVAKTRDVKDWVLKFVGAAPGSTSRTMKRTRKSWDRPPDDTQ